MGVSLHIRTAYSELIGWLKTARIMAARRRSIRVDADLCASADRFIAAIALETGVDEVRRRAMYLRESTGSNSDYQRVALAACNAGVNPGPGVLYGGLKTPRVEGWVIHPIDWTHWAYEQW